MNKRDRKLIEEKPITPDFQDVVAEYLMYKSLILSEKEKKRWKGFLPSANEIRKIQFSQRNQSKKKKKKIKLLWPTFVGNAIRHNSIRLLKYIVIYFNNRIVFHLITVVR